MRFRTIPQEVEARQFLNDASTPELVEWLNAGRRSFQGKAYWSGYLLYVPSIRWIAVEVGEWILRDGSDLTVLPDANGAPAGYEVIQERESTKHSTGPVFRGQKNWNIRWANPSKSQLRRQ